MRYIPVCPFGYNYESLYLSNLTFAKTGIYLQFCVVLVMYVFLFLNQTSFELMFLDSLKNAYISNTDYL